jgi:hypothetical protein
VRDGVSLANASAYWFTNAIESSIRRYYADAHGETAPTTAANRVAIFAEDFQTIRKLAERDHRGIVSWNRYERGSHFAPHDAPDLLVGLSARQRPRWTLVDAAWTPSTAAGVSNDNGNSV